MPMSGLHEFTQNGQILYIGSAEVTARPGHVVTTYNVLRTFGPSKVKKAQGHAIERRSPCCLSLVL